ncbi:TNT domain-containing protein [Mycobacterium hubeiense]|uniref:TNT domain-containing protein n=1 Tax=Mycobacterium hubeiense TaxID=1867256 RepID=UPI000C7EEC78|nr:TNT domain-containing protein [Mycobacterium sp. QGD 101]
MEATARDHDAVAENLGKAATAMEHAGQDAEALAESIKGILDDAAQPPAVEINETTNQVVPPDTSYMTEEYAAQVAAKVADLQARIAKALAEGERVDTELAGAITSAAGTERVVKTASSLEDLLLPEDGERKPSKPDESPSSPNSLDGALDQLAGQPDQQSAAPGDSAAGGPVVPVRLDPAKVEQFKAVARQAMLRDGVPADQIEARLDAMVAAAQRPLPAYTPPKPDKMPAPGFGEGFADRWFGTEQKIKELLGQGGPGAPGVLESWREMAKGINDQFADPIGTAVDEVKHAMDSPSLAYYLGERSADAAIAAPGLVVGGEGALASRAIPHELIDSPTPAGTIDHPTPLADVPSHHSAPAIAADTPPPPLPPDSPLFDGYDPIPPGPEFTKPDGSLIYPDDSLPSKPYAVPGTVVDNAEIPRGTAIDRFGSPFGSWLSPDGTPFPERALPPDSAAKPYYQYVVDDPTKLPPGFRIEQSEVAPWFHQPGGGIQYRIIGPDGKNAPVNELLDSGFLKDLHE